MAPQGIWSGTISFSLVAIPVQLVKAIAPGRVAFHLLHDRDYSPLARRMFCPEEAQPVPPEEIVRGYEIAPGRFLPITAEELASVSPERSRTIEIVDFIESDEIDQVYYDHPYYLVPLKGGEKAYRLLAEILRRTGRTGLAKFVLAEREHLVAIRSEADALALFTLHYHEDILPTDDLAIEGGTADPAEKNRIGESIRTMLAAFLPEKYADDRRSRVLQLLKDKMGNAVVTAPIAAEPETEGPADLIAALEEIMADMKRQP